MKTIQNTTTGWMEYVKLVKEIIQRDLSRKEYSKLMNCYLNRKSVEEAVEELK